MLAVQKEDQLGRFLFSQIYSILKVSFQVPVQPNFCDCGIYLLHLAQTFMSDPARYRRMILVSLILSFYNASYVHYQAQKFKSVPNQERQVTWHDHQVTDKQKDLAARIVQLSGKWKREQAAKEEAKQKQALNSRTFEVVESSDCEIVNILEPIPSTSKAKSGRRKAGHPRGRSVRYMHPIL